MNFSHSSVGDVLLSACPFFQVKVCVWGGCGLGLGLHAPDAPDNLVTESFRWGVNVAQMVEQDFGGFDPGTRSPKVFIICKCRSFCSFFFYEYTSFISPASLLGFRNVDREPLLH